MLESIYGICLRDTSRCEVARPLEYCLPFFIIEGNFVGSAI